MMKDKTWNLLVRDSCSWDDENRSRRENDFPPKCWIHAVWSSISPKRSLCSNSRNRLAANDESLIRGIYDPETQCCGLNKQSRMKGIKLRTALISGCRRHGDKRTLNQSGEDAGWCGKPPLFLATTSAHVEHAAFSKPPGLVSGHLIARWKQQKRRGCLCCLWAGLPSGVFYVWSHVPQKCRLPCAPMMSLTPRS